MAEETENPFHPGARVVVDYGRFGSRSYQTQKVLKLHKSGRFTLEDDPAQQYTPNRSRLGVSQFWEAHASGRDNWGGGARVVLWDDTSDSWCREVLAGQQARNRLAQIRAAVEKLTAGRVTPEALDLFERALSVCVPEQKDAPK